METLQTIKFMKKIKFIQAQNKGKTLHYQHKIPASTLFRILRQEHELPDLEE